MKRTEFITMMEAQGTQTASVLDGSPRGYKTRPVESVKVGDRVILNNSAVLIEEDQKPRIVTEIIPDRYNKRLIIVYNDGSVSYRLPGELAEIGIETGADPAIIKKVRNAAWSMENQIRQEKEAEERAEENQKRCARIADELTRLVNGEPATDDNGEIVDLYDYLGDNYDVEYRTDYRGEIRSVCVMVACGGPNIYIDTEEGAVLLYWGGEKARAYLDLDVVSAVNSWAGETK